MTPNFPVEHHDFLHRALSCKRPKIHIFNFTIAGLLDLSLLIPKDEKAQEFWEEVQRRTEAPPFNVTPDEGNEVRGYIVLSIHVTILI